MVLKLGPAERIGQSLLDKLEQKYAGQLGEYAPIRTGQTYGSGMTRGDHIEGRQVITEAMFQDLEGEKVGNLLFYIDEHGNPTALLPDGQVQPFSAQPTGIKSQPLRVVLRV